MGSGVTGDAALPQLLDLQVHRTREKVMATEQKIPSKIVKVMAATAVLTFATLVLAYRLLF